MGHHLRRKSGDGGNLFDGPSAGTVFGIKPSVGDKIEHLDYLSNSPLLEYPALLIAEECDYAFQSVSGQALKRHVDHTVIPLIPLHVGGDPSVESIE
jgi:hypothetical protein